MAEIKWIKITTDMFDNRKIKHLRRLPEGNNIVLIWVMLLTIAGKCNAGGMIFLTENIPYTTKMLADELDFEENTVLLALDFLQRFGMISMNEDVLAITGWDDHQNIEGLDKIREQNRLRKQKQRDKQRLLSEPGHVKSRDSHATDIEEEKEEDKDKDYKESGEKKRKRFAKPTLEEVSEYCTERNNGINPQRFIDYYESNGWMVGKNKMKDWKAAVRNWEQRETSKPNEPAKETEKVDYAAVLRDLEQYL